MLTRAVAALGVVAIACGTPAGSSSAPPPSVAPSPAPVTPRADRADVEVAHGAFATLHYGKDGFLNIDVEHVRTPTGAVATVTYRRSGACEVDPDETDQVATCEVLWTVRHTVAATAFTFDETLDRAALTDTLRGRPVRVVWQGYGETARQIGENGNLSVEMREARGSVRWGRDRYTDPPGTDDPSRLYRRVTPLAS